MTPTDIALQSQQWQSIREALNTHRFSLHDEKELQVEIADAFVEQGLKFIREHRLGEYGIVDFWLEPGVAVEVKIKGSARQIYRQLVRYSHSEQVTSLVLVTSITMGLPKRLGKVPVFSYSLSRAML